MALTGGLCFCGCRLVAARFGRPHLRAICPPLASYLLSGAFRSASYLLATCFSLARYLLSACLEGKAHRPQTRPGGRLLPAAYPPHRRPCIPSTTLHICNAHRMRHAPTAHASAQRHASRTTSPKRHQKRGRPPRTAASLSSARRASRSTRPPSTRRGSFSARLVALGTDDNQTARGKHLLMFLSTTTPRRDGLLLGTTTLRRGRLLLDTTAPQRGGLLVRHGWFVPPRRTSLRFLDNIST